MIAEEQKNRLAASFASHLKVKGATNASSRVANETKWTMENNQSNLWHNEVDTFFLYIKTFIIPAEF